jgi:hypothetical protein
MNFQITALERERFAKFFAMSDEELAGNLAVRMAAAKKPGFRCRVNLADAEVGDDLILVNYEHQVGCFAVSCHSCDYCAQWGRASPSGNQRSTRAF